MNLSLLVFVPNSSRLFAGLSAFMALSFCVVLAAACGEERKDEVKGDDDVGAAAVSDAIAVDDADGSEGDEVSFAPQDVSVAEEIAGQGGQDGFTPRWPDTGQCKPACIKGDGTLLICGPDGCGSVCGFCKSGQFCAKEQTACEAFCDPKCAGKKCGPDGCGGECGSCLKGFECGKDGLCYKENCVASCEKKVCGDDGCGGSCGDCAKGDLCDASGECKPGPCKGIPEEGVCNGAIWSSCQGQGAMAKVDNVDCGAKDQVCGWDPVAGANGCVAKGICVPNCTTKSGQKKECGADGCDGICGKCPAGWACPGGLCKPEMGAACGGLITAQGQCVGQEWIFCSGGTVVIIDCAKAGESCGWRASESKFGCS